MAVSSGKSDRRQRAVIAWLASMVLPLLCDAKPASADFDEAPVLLPTVKTPAKPKNVSELQKMAEQGDPQACFDLGTRYLDGIGVAADPAKALVWLERAAHGGNSAAAFRAGKLYHDGEGVPQDYGRSLEFYTLAAQGGEMEAQHNIGAMLVSARGVKRDFVEGLAWLLVAKKAGDDSDAVNQVRAQLAKRPKELAAAEFRAQEILEDLPHAKIYATLRGAPSSAAAKIEPPKPAPAHANPVTAPVSVEKPALPLPPVIGPGTFQISLPEKPLMTLPEPKAAEPAKP